MVALFVVTIFLGAALLFLVEPMFARLVLPLLGGSPSVWITAMLFYQAALMAGYAFAHAGTARLHARRHVLVQIAVLLAALLVLPLAVPAGWTPPADANPLPWLLALMTLTVGLPFFAVSTMSPALQKWFCATGHPQAGDPYFLFAASNLGSILALLAYPVLIEPRWTLAEQMTAWTWGYTGFIALAAGCGVWVWKSPLAPAVVLDATSPVSEPPTARRRAHWVLLAFVPSSLLLGVTTYLSSEVAVIPLLWVIPLALYLLTFVLAFARRQIFSQRALARALPILLVAVAMALDLQATVPLGGLMLLHLAAFFVAALACHARLAADRPAPAHLTEFYLWLSAGGVLGGIFNAVLAPLVFNTVAEYPLALILAAFLGVAPQAVLRAAAADWLWPLALGVAGVLLVLGYQASALAGNPAAAGVVFSALALGVYFFSGRPQRFGLGLAALFLADLFYDGGQGRALHLERSFFGLHRVTVDAGQRYHLLIHGKTLHGMQSLDPARAHESLAYYYRTGPIGDVLRLYGHEPAEKIGVIGLGAGSLASYALPGQGWTFFEIDPAVLRLARDEKYFTFLRDSSGKIRVVLGDARLSLAGEPDRVFDLLVVDAFSSDAIPVHLVTREALALYLRKLMPGGVLAFHISNVHLDLEPVLANLARDARLDAYVRDDTLITDAESALGKSPSIWLVMRSPEAGPPKLTALGSDWHPARPDDRHAVWTDDYSSVLSIFRWR